MSTHKKVVLIEFADELEDFLAHLNESGSNLTDFLVVALQPEVTAYGKKNHIDTLNTLAFFNNRSHENALEKSAELTGLMADKLTFKLESPVRHTLNNTFIYYCRLYINNFTWILEVLKGIRTVYPNSEIYTFKRQQQVAMGQGSGDPFLSKNDRFIPTIVERYWTAKRLPPAALPGAKLLKKFDQNVLLKRITRKLFLAKLEKYSTAKMIFLTAPSYNLDRLGKEIQQQIPGLLCATTTPNVPSTPGYLKLCLKMLPGLSLHHTAGFISIPLAVFTDTGEKGSLDTGLEQLKESYREFIEVYGNAFSYEGCSFLEELNQKVEGDLLPHLYDLHRLAAAQQRILEHLQPNLLVSPLSVGPDQGWAELGSKLKIPSLVIPQKGLVAPRNNFARLEEHYIGKAQVSDDFSYAAAQTPLVKEYLTWSNYNGTVLETGNLILAKPPKPPTRQEKNGRKVIVYAPSMKSRKSRRFFVLETLDELLASISDLIAVISQMEQVDLVLRVHPGEPITRQQIETLIPLPPKVSISDSGTFEELLARAAVVISFSSTSIQEALLNRVPVVLYDKWNRYNHLQAPCFNGNGTTAPTLSAAYYVKEKEVLAPCLRWVLEKLEKKEMTTETFREYIFPEDRQGKFMEFVKEIFASGGPMAWGTDKALRAS
jgi:hypothetical protein